MAVPPSRVWPGSSGPTTVSQQDCFIRRVVFLLPGPLPRQRPAGCVLQSAMSNTASVLVGDTGARPPPLWLLSSPTQEPAPLYSLRQRLSLDCPSVVHSLSSPTLEKLGWGGKCHHLAQPLHRGDPENLLFLARFHSPITAKAQKLVFLPPTRHEQPRCLCLSPVLMDQSKMCSLAEAFIPVSGLRMRPMG